LCLALAGVFSQTTDPIQGEILKMKIWPWTKGIIGQRFRCNITNWKLFLSSAALLAVVLFGAFLRVHILSGALPYPGHQDEKILARKAANILKTGNLNPKFFKYPSVPIYLTAAAFTLGYVNAASSLDLKDAGAINADPFPYFKYPRIVWPAKALFLLLSVVTIYFTGKVAYQAHGSPYLLFLAPLILLMSSTFFLYSHKYLNVDIVGAFFVMALYFYQFNSLSKDTIAHKSFYPGAITALAVASKYTLIWLIVPSILVVLLYSQKMRIYKIILLLLFVAVVFVLVMPFSILDLRTFLNDIGSEAYHYADQHRGYTSSSNASQLKHYLISGVDEHGLNPGKALMRDFGYGSAILVLIGLFTLLTKKWKRAVIILSYPTVFLWYMSRQKVNFFRNIVSLYAFYALLAAIGFIGVYRLLQWIASHRVFKNFSQKQKRLTSLMILAAVCLIFFPVPRLVKWTMAKPDSRNLAETWIRENIEHTSTVIIPEELAMNVEPLKKDYTIFQWSFKEYKKKDDFISTVRAHENPYIIMPVFGCDPRKDAGRNQAKTLNTFCAEADTLTNRLGENRILINYSVPVPQGDPQLYIGQIRTESGEEQTVIEKQTEGQSQSGREKQTEENKHTGRKIGPPAVRRNDQDQKKAPFPRTERVSPGETHRN